MSYNSLDRKDVERIHSRLVKKGLCVFMDEDELRSGYPWQTGVEKGIRASLAVAVLVGKAGLGHWQTLELWAFLSRSRFENLPVIPVLLPGCPKEPPLPFLLKSFRWVDLRKGLTDSGLDALAEEITGKSDGKPGVPAARSQGSFAGDWKVPRSWRMWGAVLVLPVGVFCAWFWLRSPALYSVRVQVLDPEGRPVAGATIHVSAGNEPQRLLDGWWEVEVPGAKAPADGQITIWVEHEDWEGNRKDLHLGADANPRAEIRLKKPESWLRGLVSDVTRHPLSYAKVSCESGASKSVVTDKDGRFALKLPLPKDVKIRIRAEHEGFAPVATYCYSGDDGCPIVLEKK
ncbi:MAG: TIR domain-containing protein [Thermoanaerobaculia bacterium]